ncbi:MAG: T9SS type A sorting domain-containing protein [Saprospiraceae bacterium]
MPGITSSQTDISVCDNGGFESDFLYYTASNSSFYRSQLDGYGSESCSPAINGNLVTFTDVSSLPVPKRFEIATSGNDPITGVNKVLFGSNSLMINSYLNYFDNPIWNHKGDINRVSKSFLVTEENRNFTVWYSAILENPAEHTDQQPFFSLYCDLSVSSNLCYDGTNFPGKTVIYYDDCQTPNLKNQEVKYTDWACHRFYIPKEQVGNIATLEITAADCARGGHFGYVYIDGICEPCDYGSYGSSTLPKPDIVISCDGDSITIQGTYTLPTIDGDYTDLDSITVPGFNIFDLIIDTTSMTFRFRVVKTDFESPNDDCRDIIAYLYFGNGTDELPPVPTNGIEICLDDFVSPILDLTIGSCNRNHPTNNVFSDDYYFVDVSISNADSIYWTLERQLDDPYPDESGHYTLKSNGYGNGSYNLGPFLIQEGKWILIFNHNHCSDTFQIIPPDYCSGCGQLRKTIISDISCDYDTINMINNWSYTIEVPYSPQQGDILLINGVQFTYNMPHIIPVGDITQGCVSVNVRYRNEITFQTCIVTFDICPPKPCGNMNNNYETCDLEVYLKKLNCINNGNGTYSYSVELNVSGAGSPCYNTNPPCATGVQGCSFNNPLGPYNSDITLKVYSCGSSSSCTCPNTLCYKLLKIHKPEDCDTREGLEESTLRSKLIEIDEVQIQPNPFSSDEFLIRSKLKRTDYVIYNSSGQHIYSSSFENSETRLRINLSSGLYFLRYKNSYGDYSVIKIIKL